MPTTCHNFKCPNRSICNFNIWEANSKINPICKDYMSSIQWSDLSRPKEIPYNLYHEF
jgi:hypothetical protein